MAPQTAILLEARPLKKLLKPLIYMPENAHTSGKDNGNSDNSSGARHWAKYYMQVLSLSTHNDPLQ